MPRYSCGRGNPGAGPASSNQLVEVDVPFRTVSEIRSHESSLPSGDDEKMLTIGKQESQAIWLWVDRKSFRGGSPMLPGWAGLLTDQDIIFRLLAILLHVSPDIGRYAKEIQDVLLLAGGHKDEPPEQSDLPTVRH